MGRCARVEAAGRRRDSRDGTEAPLARLRMPLPLCAGVTARLAAAVLPPEVVRGGWVAVFFDAKKKQTAVDLSAFFASGRAAFVLLQNLDEFGELCRHVVHTLLKPCQKVERDDNRKTDGRDGCDERTLHVHASLMRAA